MPTTPQDTLDVHTGSSGGWVQVRPAEPGTARLIRESRGLLVKTLAELVGKTPGYVSKVESGSFSLAGDPLKAYAKALEVDPLLLATPHASQPLEGAHFRSHVSTPQWLRKKAVADANWADLILSRLMNLVDADVPRALPHIDPELVEGGPAAVAAEAAALIRRYWRISGRVEHMTGLLESAGVFVLPMDLADRQVDAVTIRGTGPVVAVILLRDDLPAERRRMTLAHELGHLLLDREWTLPLRTIEARANAFAAEFLVPIDEVATDLQGITPQQLGHLDALRQYWGVSVAALIRHAHQAGCITAAQYRYWFRVLNSQGLVRGRRPGPGVEQARAAGDLLATLHDDGLSLVEIVEETRTSPTDLQRLFGAQWPYATPRRLHAVPS